MYKRQGNSLTIAFGLALIFIYLVLAAQFESFRSPLIIMFSVPTAMLGALLALLLTGGSINIYSQIGLITLVGLITKHGILIVEFANQLQQSGASKLEAVIESAKLRLRPILMTSMAFICGVIPLAIASSAGSGAQNALGISIIGGTLASSILVVVFIFIALWWVVSILLWFVRLICRFLFLLFFLWLRNYFILLLINRSILFYKRFSWSWIRFWSFSYDTVSYTHLTLPTTPYV